MNEKVNNKIKPLWRNTIFVNVHIALTIDVSNSFLSVPCSK